MVSQEDIIDFFSTHKKQISLGVICLILLIILIVYLNTDFSHKEIYKSHQLFYNDKEILVGFEDLPSSEENIKSRRNTMNYLSLQENFFCTNVLFSSDKSSVCIYPN